MKRKATVKANQEERDFVHEAVAQGYVRGEAHCVRNKLGTSRRDTDPARLEPFRYICLIP